MEGMRQTAKAKFGWGMVFLIVLMVGVLIGKGWDRAVMATETYEELKTFTEVLAHVQKHYVEEVKTKDLVYGAIRGMLATLDPHSAFMPPEVYKEVQVETKGEFGGVGIQIGMKENRLTVIAPIDGTPAERAGVKAADIILKVNNESTKDMTLMDEGDPHDASRRGPRAARLHVDTGNHQDRERQGQDVGGQHRLHQADAVSGPDCEGHGRGAQEAARTKDAAADPRPAEQSRRASDVRHRSFGAVCRAKSAHCLY